jgi:hypothetical protein
VVGSASRADRVLGTLSAEAAAARPLTTVRVASGCTRMVHMVRSVVVAELLRARTKEFLLSAVAVELVPEARVLEARAPAERLAVPRRDARGDFQAAPEDQAAGDRAERDRGA